MHKRALTQLMLSAMLASTLLPMASSSLAAIAPSVAADPALEKRVLALSEELRCLVCQNQTIADSHADLAIDLRNQVREKLGQGMSDKEVIDFMVTRYGDFVLYRPPLKTSTWLLWFGPFLLLFGGILFLVLKLRARRGVDAELSDTEQTRVATLLGNSPLTSSAHLARPADPTSTTKQALP